MSKVGVSDQDPIDTNFPDLMLSFVSYLAGPVRSTRAPAKNEAALPAFHSQDTRMEALRTHNLGVSRLRYTQAACTPDPISH